MTTLDVYHRKQRDIVHRATAAVVTKLSQKATTYLCVQHHTSTTHSMPSAFSNQIAVKFNSKLPKNTNDQDTVKRAVLISWSWPPKSNDKKTDASLLTGKLRMEQTRWSNMSHWHWWGLVGHAVCTSAGRRTSQHSRWWLIFLSLLLCLQTCYIMTHANISHFTVNSYWLHQ